MTRAGRELEGLYQICLRQHSSNASIKFLCGLLFVLFSVFHKVYPRVTIPFHAPPMSMFWQLPVGAPRHTCVSDGVLQELRENHGMNEACPDVLLDDLSVDKWPESAFDALQSASLSDLLSADARAHGVRIGASTILGGGRGVFAERSFAVGESILPFFGLVV